MLNAFRLFPALCPKCGAMLDGATGLTDDHQPSPGDLTICAYCATVMEFDAQLKPQMIAPDKVDALCKADPRLARGLRWGREAALRFRMGGFAPKDTGH